MGNDRNDASAGALNRMGVCCVSYVSPHQTVRVLCCFVCICLPMQMSVSSRCNTHDDDDDDDNT